MIVAWLFGDAFKAFYFFRNGAPIQFIICGIIQLVVDILIAGQIFFYPRRASQPVRILPFENISSTSLPLSPPNPNASAPFGNKSPSFFYSVDCQSSQRINFEPELIKTSP
jgi:hypothetical protein